MTMTPSSYRRFRFPAEVIEHAVWLCHCFSPSLRDVETVPAARGVAVSYETVREGGLRFGRLFANTLKRRRPKPGDNQHRAARDVALHTWCAVLGAASAA